MSEIKLCEYCQKRPILRKTCGNFTCQFKRHILQMRKNRKTEQKRPTRRVL